MMNMTTFELPCYDSRQSFYGKARVVEKPNGWKYLLSYDTFVAKISPKGHFYRLWDGESMTTTRHINSFLRHYGLSGGGVAWWRQQPVHN